MSLPSPQRDTLDRVMVILREELKLGVNATIEDDTPLIGGDFDFDSLDVLLLVTSVEKAFGIKIPNEAVGREAFVDVTSIARFIEHTGATESSS